MSVESGVTGRGPGCGGDLGHAPGEGGRPRGHEGHHPAHLHTPLLPRPRHAPRGGEVPVRPHVSRHVCHVLRQRHGARARVLEVFWQTLASVTSLQGQFFYECIESSFINLIL